MKKANRSLRLYFFFAIAITVVLATARIIFMTRYYDVEVELYRIGAQHVGIFAAVFCLSALGMLTVGFFLKGAAKKMRVFPRESLATSFAGALCSLGFISALFSQFFYFFPAVLKEGTPSDKGLFIASMLLCLPTAVYFFAVAASRNIKITALQYLSFFPVLWGIVYCSFVYFDSTRVLNSPERNLIQLSLITLMLYFLAESRYHLGKASPPLYIGISLLSMVVVGTVAVPNLLLSAFWVMPMTQLSIFSAVEILLAFYILSRVLSFITSPQMRRGK